MISVLYNFITSSTVVIYLRKGQNKNFVCVTKISIVLLVGEGGPKTKITGRAGGGRRRCIIYTVYMNNCIVYCGLYSLYMIYKIPEEGRGWVIGWSDF